MRNLPVGLIRCKIQLIFADNAVVPTAGCGGVTPPAKHPAGRPVNSQAGRLRYVAFGLALRFIFCHSHIAGVNASVRPTAVSRMNKAPPAAQ
jgi:hypothetical protein